MHVSVGVAPYGCTFFHPFFVEKSQNAYWIGPAIPPFTRATHVIGVPVGAGNVVVVVNEEIERAEADTVSCGELAVRSNGAGLPT